MATGVKGAQAEAAGQRLPPQNLEAEVAVLGAIIQEKQALLKALEILTPAHFYREAHEKVFAACADLSERNEPVDLVTLTNELMRRNQLEGVGGAAYLANLIEAVPTAANVEYHARIVREKALLRNLISTATNIVSSAYADNEPPDQLMDWAEREVFNLSQERVSRAFTPIRAVLKGTFDEIEHLSQREGQITGVSTGFDEFDEMTGGLQAGELIIVAGRPSMGKTSLSLNIAAHAGLEGRTPVGIFSVEMSTGHVVQRMLCSEARVEAYRLRTGRLDTRDWPKLTTAAGRLSEAAVFIDDTPALSVLELRSKARRLKAEQQLGLLIVDYLQLLRGVGRAENRQQEISEICRSLKGLAKELNIPVVALSQLSRAVEARENKRPQLADLRESGAIEQDADMVVFIYRPGYYKDQKAGEEDSLAEIIIGKQRNGPTGVVKLAFLKQYTRFEPAELRREPPWPSSGAGPRPSGRPAHPEGWEPDA